MRFDAGSGLYESRAGNKHDLVQLLTIKGLLHHNQRAEHPNYEPGLNFKKSKGESDAGQSSLLYNIY